MAASNQSYLEKADLAVADLISSGGYLAAEQAKQFMSIAIDESTLLPTVTVVPMNSPTYEINKMAFESRVLRPGVESGALGTADRVKPTLGRVQITTTELRGEARIPYGVIEDNIANGSFPEYLISELAKACSRDVEELVVQGDTTSTDTYLALFNGILAQATTNVVSAGGVRLTKTQLKVMVQTLASRFLRSQKNLAFITSKNAAIDYSDSLANRQTALGDAKLVAAAAGEYFGFPVIPVGKFPENLGGGTNMTDVLLCDPKNIHVGWQRQIRIETQRDISACELVVVASLRVGVKFAHEPATVKLTNVLATAGA